MKHKSIYIAPPIIRCSNDDAEMIIHITARYFGFDPESLKVHNLDYRRSLASKIAINLCRLYTGARYDDLAPYFNRSRPHMTESNTSINRRVCTKDRILYSHYLAIVKEINNYVDSIYVVGGSQHKPQFYQIILTHMQI